MALNQKKSAIFLFLFLWLVSPRPLFAQSTPNVPLDSPHYVYASIDKLIAFGLVNSAVYGQRPWSRNEAARLVSEALDHLEKKCPASPEKEEPKGCSVIHDILGSLKLEFYNELVARGALSGRRKKIEIHPIDSAYSEFRFTNADFRKVPPKNGLGAIDARVNSFTMYKGGRHYVEGENFWFETDHWAKLTNYASLYVRPHFEGQVDLEQDGKADVTLQNAYAKFNIANFELEAGRDAVIWGQSAEGGVLASTNARPMDMVKISNDNPFTLPWIFKYLGYNKYTLFVSDLGPESIYKNALMYGFAASFKPLSFLEFGFEHQFTFGGNGAPDYDALDLLSEFFFHRITGDINGGDNIGDHRMGWNLRIQIPPLRNSTFYAEGIFEDRRFREFWNQFSQQMAFQSGVDIPLLTSDGKDNLKLQYEHIPAAYGRHSQWKSGLSLNELSRGSPFASQSQSLLAEWEHLFSPARRLKLQTMYINNGNDQFKSVPLPDGGTGEVVKTVDNPQEHRFLVEGSYTWLLGERWWVEPSLGYEFVSNFNFEQDHDLQNLLLGVSVSCDLDLKSF